MHIIEVFPLTKGVRAERLTYFTSSDIMRGTIVSVPLRSREVTAIVINTAPAKSYKSVLKDADYEIKRVNSVGNQIFFARFIEAVQSFARFSGVTTGAALHALTPAPITKNSSKLPSVSSDIFIPDISAPKANVIQASKDKRYQYINSLVQSEIKDGASVFLCAPTTRKIAEVKNKLSGQASVYTFHSDLTSKQIRDNWKQALADDQPTVLLGTVPFLSLPREDIGQIIVLEEGDTSYKMNSRPYLDKRLFARHLANHIKRDCTLTDKVLQTETLYEYRNDELGSEHSPQFRYTNGPDGELVDMKSLPDTQTSGVRVFSPPVAQILRDALQENKKILFFVARRGRRPFTVCNDCGEIVQCNNCNYPLVLTEDDDGTRKYTCRTCDNIETSARRCDNCGGWRLTALGIGIDFIANILKEELPNLPAIQIDGTTTDSPAKVKKAYENFNKKDSAVLLTTELGVNYFDQLEDKVDSSAIITADSIMAVPDLHISHKLFRLLLLIREQTKNQFCIQTRNEETDLFEDSLSGDVTSFYRRQIEERERFNYPPFSHLLKLTVRGKENRVKKTMSKISKVFDEYDPRIYPGQSNSKYVAHALLTFDNDEWPSDTVTKKLRSLPPAVAIDTHPQSLL